MGFGRVGIGLRDYIPGLQRRAWYCVECEDVHNINLTLQGILFGMKSRIQNRRYRLPRSRVHKALRGFRGRVQLGSGEVDDILNAGDKKRS